jgi:hypothetical protein
MKTLLASILITTSFFASKLVATPLTITFDDLTTQTGISSITGIPNGYQGLDWYNFYAAASDAYPGSTFSNGVVSGDYAALDGYGQTPATISSDIPFTFDSADLTDQWDPSDTVEVQGYLAGNPVFDTTINITSDAPSGPTDFTAIDPTPVDTVNFTITGDPLNDNFVLDNLAVTFVPEPASLGLVGIAALALLRRRPRTIEAVEIFP